MVQRKHVTV